MQLPIEVAKDDSIRSAIEAIDRTVATLKRLGLIEEAA